MRRDIFYHQVRCDNESINSLCEDEIFDNYIDSIKSDIKRLVTKTTVDDPSTDTTTFKMELAIMSTQEYRRLKGIERLTLRLLDKPE